MTYVIGSACVDVMDKSCVLECPADCDLTREHARCTSMPTSAWIVVRASRSAGWRRLSGRPIYPTMTARILPTTPAFFQTVLPGRDKPLGSPGGAQAVGRVGADTPLVAAMPVKPHSDH